MESRKLTVSMISSRNNFPWKKYDSIDSEKRKGLLRLIETNIGVKQASEELGINYQTAKSIIRRYRLSGKIDRINRILRKKELPQGNQEQSKDDMGTDLIKQVEEIKQVQNNQGTKAKNVNDRAIFDQVHKSLSTSLSIIPRKNKHGVGLFQRLPQVPLSRQPTNTAASVSNENLKCTVKFIEPFHNVDLKKLNVHIFAFQYVKDQDLLQWKSKIDNEVLERRIIKVPSIPHNIEEFQQMKEFFDFRSYSNVINQNQNQ